MKSIIKKAGFIACCAIVGVAGMASSSARAGQLFPPIDEANSGEKALLWQSTGNKVIAVPQSSIKVTTTGNCTANQIMTGISNGAATCSSLSVASGNSCSAGSFAVSTSVVDGQVKVVCSNSSSLPTPPSCTGGSYALHWNSGNWSCDPISSTGTGGGGLSTPPNCSGGSYALQWSNGGWYCSQVAATGTGGSNLPTPPTCSGGSNALQWSNGNWSCSQIASTGTGGGGSSIPTPPTCTGNNALQWNGGSWNCTAISGGNGGGGNISDVTIVYGEYPDGGAPLYLNCPSGYTAAGGASVGGIGRFILCKK